MSETLKELFVLNPDTQLVDINKPWISTIKEFKVLLKRDKGIAQPGGRRKAQAEKEFTLIYHLVDYRSAFADYSDFDRVEAALVNAGYDKNYEYLKDEALAAAIEVYSIMRETAGLQMLQELKQGLHASRRVVRKIRINLESLLDNLDSLTEEQLKEQGFGKGDAIIAISDRMDRLMAITQQLPKALKSIEDLEANVKKELSGEARLRGGVDKGTREDPVGVPTAVASSPFDKL